MYLAVDIGGTKTLLACFDDAGTVTSQVKFPTPEDYDLFLDNLKGALNELDQHDFQSACMAVPGRLDRVAGIGQAFGNLSWHDVPIQADVERIIHCPVVIENDANLAGLSEAIAIKDTYKKVVYITISTGIGTGVIVNGKIDPVFADSEGGQMLVEHHGHLVRWESFASGKAIVAKYGKPASDINDPAIWKTISQDFAIGMLDIIAVIQPDAIVIGGGVGSHFAKFQAPLLEALKKYEIPLMPIPPILEAKHPEEAVIYGCFELARSHHGKAVTAS